MESHTGLVPVHWPRIDEGLGGSEPSIDSDADEIDGSCPLHEISFRLSNTDIQDINTLPVVFRERSE